MEPLFVTKLRVLAATLSSFGLTAEASEVDQLLNSRPPATNEEDKVSSNPSDADSFLKSRPTKDGKDDFLKSRPPKDGDKKEIEFGGEGLPEAKEKTNRASESNGAEEVGDDFLLDYGVGSSSDIKSLQKNLLAACFSLPRFGVDGIYKSETRKAVKEFKRKAKQEGKYFGAIDGKVNRETFDLLKEYADKSDCSRKEVSSKVVSKSNEKWPVITKDIGKSSQESGNFTFYIGDSQMGYHLGRALSSAGGSGVMKSKVGARASTWNLRKDEELIPILEKGPSKIIISLNGNGISGTDAFIKTLSDNIKPGTKVIWTGAPPPLRKKKSSYTKLTSDPAFAAYYDQRNRWNKTVKTKVEAKGWIFINPYDHIKYDNPLVIGSRTFTSGYVCSKCDGIHLPASVAKDYVSKIQSML